MGRAALLDCTVNDGSLPMHLATRRWRDCCWRRGGAGQLAAEDKGGELPMHQAAAFSSSPEVVRLLLEVGGEKQPGRRIGEAMPPKDLAVHNGCEG